MATMSLQATYDQARSYLEANQVEQAIGVAQHILKHFPENLEAHRILGEAYLAGRQFDHADDAFSRVLRADPENIPAHVGLGITFERQAKLDRAVAEFEQALEVRPDMPELRGQLLRLYTDLWGAEGATLRLSRPGLARLYAKGHMLAQAIQEFRSVVEEHPDRFDAWVGLAEALWRDGQEEESAEVCALVLGQRPDVLKANLLLGFIRLASSDKSGEPYWRLAQQLDPYQQVARSLFDALPDIAPPDLDLPTWDEAAWLGQQAREVEQHRAAQQPPPAVAPVATPAASPAEEDSWLDEAEHVTAAPVSTPRATPAPAPETDDFLAGLLALNTPPVPTDVGSDLDSSSGVTPFSFDDFDFSAATPPPAQPASLADHSLSRDEVPLVPAVVAADSFAEEPPAVAEESPEPFSFDEPAATDAALEPFSLLDLGLSPEEIAQLNATTPVHGTELEPFSLDDFGFDEPAATAAPVRSPLDAEGMEPFSLADLGLNPDEIAELEAQTPPETDGALTPFSLADLGLDSDELAGLEGDTPPSAFSDANPADPEPFNWDDVESNAVPPDSLDVDSGLGDLQPFSLDDLDLNALDDDTGIGALPPSLQPFSLDDTARPQSSAATPLPVDSDESVDASGGYSWQQPSAKNQTDFLRAAAAESHKVSIFGRLKQHAAERPPEELPPLPPVSDDDSDSASYFSNDEVPLHDEEPRSSERFVSGFRLPKEGAPGMFAADLSAEPPPHHPAAEPAALSPEPAARPAAEEEPDLMPFSLADLGLSAEEIAQLEQPTAPEPTAPQAADEEPELTPFSLADLGLSAEEIAALEGNAVLEPEAPLAAAADEPAFEPFSLADLGLDTDEHTPVEGATDEPAFEPFSLADLGLSAEEIAQLDGATDTAAAPPMATPDEPAFEPFSLADLGLSAKEIAQLEAANRGELPFPVTGETIVPGWSRGEEPELTPFTFESAEVPPAPEALASDVQPFSMDDFDFEAGTGEDNAAGIDASVGADVQPFSMDDFDFDTGTGEDNAAGIDASVGADVQPFSMDDFDFDTGTDKRTAAGVDASVGADVQPFSMDDLGLGDQNPADAASRELGLTPEELAGLDLGDFESLIGDASQSTVAENPEATLERLMRLGRKQGYVDLTDIISVVSDPEAEAERIEEMGWALHNAGIQIRDGDEVIDMEGEEGEEGEESEEEAVAETPVTLAPTFEGEPDLTPFSLSELGLSADEIAAMGLDAVPSDLTPPPAAAVPTPAVALPLEANEPALTPFSLADLGLSPEEIAMLEGAGAAETPAPEPPVEAGEPELTPFSLADLGLSAEDIAMLEGAGAAETPAPAAPEPPVEAGEPELTPFSLADLGLSAEDIALLEGTGAAETPTSAPEPPVAASEPALTPFSLADLGLSPEEIALLGDSVSVDSVAAEVELTGDDMFDFGGGEAPPIEKVTKRTEPRIVEPPPPVDPLDLQFKPEALDSLDDIWDAPPPAPPTPPAAPVAQASPSVGTASAAPARVVLPPLSERRREPPPKVTSSRTPSAQRGNLSRDDERFARREELEQHSRDEGRFARRDRHDATRWREVPEAPPTAPITREFAGFVPTGDPILDDYLGQLDLESDNYGLALAIGRLCAQTGRPAIMALAFKRLVRAGQGIDQLAEELEGLIEVTGDQSVKQQLYRLLGDTYSKQGRYREAMNAYGTTFGR